MDTPILEEISSKGELWLRKRRIMIVIIEALAIRDTDLLSDQRASVEKTNRPTKWNFEMVRSGQDLES